MLIEESVISSKPHNDKNIDESQFLVQNHYILNPKF